MSVHSVLTGSTVWPADLVTAAVVTAAARVYAGRAPQKVVATDTEVWLERLPVREEGRGLQAVSLHPYNVHVRKAQNRGGNQAGSEQLTTVEAHMRTIAARYNGARPFYASLATMIACEASEESVDRDPEDEMILDGVVRVTFAVKG